MLVIYRDGVRCPVSILVVLNHHRDLKVFERFFWERYADVTARMHQYGGRDKG